MSTVVSAINVYFILQAGNQHIYQPVGKPGKHEVHTVLP